MYQPKRLKPVHYFIIRAFWHGESQQDIAARFSFSAQQVSNILNCEEARGILQQLTDGILDTSEETESELTLAAPQAAKVLVDRLSSGDEKISLIAAKDILDRKGHMPAKRVQFSGLPIAGKRYEGKTDDEIRAMLLGEIGPSCPPDQGPDGRPLN